MGKFERGEAEVLERGLTDLLNNRQPARQHRCLMQLYREVSKSYPHVKRAEFVGRTYNEPGDIKLLLSNGRIAYIELKLVKRGKGTRANLSQNALTDLRLLYDPHGHTLSWSQFRKSRKFDELVNNELNKFGRYPTDVKTKEEKARYLRDNYIKPRPGSPIEKKADEIVKRGKNRDEVLAAEIVLRILELARRDKLEYIQYLKGLEQDSDRIKKFAILLLLGFHKMGVLKRGMGGFDQVINSLRSGDFEFKTYYIIRGSCRILLEDLSCLIQKLLNAHFKIEFPENETNVVIKYCDDAGACEALLRIVFHWKNVFQGIKTPCLNVFDDGILKDYLSCHQI